MSALCPRQNITNIKPSKTLKEITDVILTLCLFFKFCLYQITKDNYYGNPINLSEKILLNSFLDLFFVGYVCSVYFTVNCQLFNVLKWVLICVWLFIHTFLHVCISIIISMLLFYNLIEHWNIIYVLCILIYIGPTNYICMYL